VVVEVEDNGPGIPEKIQHRVFDSFFTTKPPGSGTGLGLDISRSIITDRHGGWIGLESAPGRTVFRVKLASRPPT
jgi:signal transduction histidine kinase